jgi:elongation factor G
VAEVIRPPSDPYVGRLSLVPVFSGTLRADDVVHVSGTSASSSNDGAACPSRATQTTTDDERVGPLSSPARRRDAATNRGIAGEVVLVSKLAHAETSDTLSAEGPAGPHRTWVLPEPLLPIAIHAVQQARRGQARGALQRVVART